MSSSSTTLAPPKEVHFLALVHGMWGSPDHLKFVDDTILKKFKETDGDITIHTLRAETNSNSHTYDGLDWGAERVVKEIYAEVEKLEADGATKVTKFSIFGYSLGGLISRYVIGILRHRGFFNRVKPVNFTTFATPHIGLPRYRGVIGAAMHKLGPIMLSRTGRQFYGTDNDKWSPNDVGRPLLEVMADKDSVFFKALESFAHVTFYGSAVNDLTVMYCTAMAEARDPFTVLKSKDHRLAIKLDPKYKNVIQSFEEVPLGEEVPLCEIDRLYKAERDAMPWYSPSRYRSRQALPPFLTFPFPLNLLFYLLIPVIIPAGLTYAAIRFQRESHSSRRRLKDLLESPEAQSSLAAMLQRVELAVADAVDPPNTGLPNRRWSKGLESKMEEGVAVAGDKPGNDARKRKASRPGTPDGPIGSLPTPATTPAVELKSNPMSSKYRKSKSKADDSRQPLLTPGQLAMVESLNSIPHLQKVRAYFPAVRNAHPIIIVRDPEQFPMHLDGEGVVTHWADRFVL